MHGQLNERDLRAGIDSLRELYAETNAAALPMRMLAIVSQLVPCKLAAFTEVDPVLARSRGHVYPPGDWNMADIEQTFQAHINDHPVIAYSARTRDGQAKAISDFLTARQFHATGLYREVFKPMGVEDQLSIGMMGRAGLMIGVSFNRAKRGFLDRERELLNLLRPHLLQAYLNCHELQLLRNADSSRRGGIVEQLPLGLINLNAKGAVIWSTATARQMLLAHFDDAKDSVHGLPNDVRLWWRSVSTAKANGTANHLRSVRPGFELRIRLCPLKDGSVVLLLQENPDVRTTRTLNDFALTPREQQVMQSLLQGRSVSEVATQLLISPRTVQKHLERIFPKLGVNNLTAACVKLISSHGSSTHNLEPAGHR